MKSMVSESVAAKLSSTPYMIKFDHTSKRMASLEVLGQM